MRFLGAVLTATILIPGLAAAQNPPRIKRQPTPPANQKTPKTTNDEPPSAPPLGEMQFYRLVQQVRQREMNPDEAERILGERGIAFELTDEILERARSLGASERLITALVKADDFRRTGGLSAQQPNTPPPADAPRASTEDFERREKERIARLPFIEQARELALATYDELPDFIATQIIRRQIQRDGQWETRDVLETKVSYEHKAGERIQLLAIDGRPTSRTYEDVGGATSVGGFSSQLGAPFAREAQTSFKPVAQEKYRGRDCFIYDFAVARENSGFRLLASISGRREVSVIVGYKGSMWIDRETKRVLRVEHAAENVPADFPMSGAEMAVDYDWVTISGQKYWMPISAEDIQITNQFRQAFRNTIEFRDYRKFEGDVKVVD
jgi:hypothetical protein